MPDIAMFVVLLGEFDGFKGFSIILGMIQKDRDAMRRMAVDLEVASIGGPSSAEGWSVIGGTGMSRIDEHRRVVFVCVWPVRRPENGVRKRGRAFGRREYRTYRSVVIGKIEPGIGVGNGS